MSQSASAKKISAYHYNEMIPYTQQEMVQGCINNDRLVQRDLYNKYKDAMYTICYRILNDQDRALDAVQEGFINVFKYISSFRQESTLGAWIKTIMIRSAYKLVDNKKIAFLEDLSNIAPAVWPSKIDAMDLEKCINQLPKGARAIFLMAEIEGYSHKEISETLEISVGTSKSQLHAAKQKLQQLLGA
jgi:RNA polymerase sigma factor (sigma-70 family)